MDEQPTFPEARDSPRPPRFTDSDYREQAAFRRVLRRFLYRAELHAHEVGITPERYVLLLVTRGHPSYPDVTIGDIATSLQIRHHSASLLVDRSVHNGLMRRVRATVQDRRRVLASLTDDGQRILDHVMEANRRELIALERDLFSVSFLSALQESARRQTGTVIDPDRKSD
ncbi:MAG: hypothetical protein PVSMB7_21790 [Chloroflexota bacterium]